MIPASRQPMTVTPPGPPWPRTVPPWIILTVLLFLSPAGVMSQESNPWTHSFYFENDLFCGTDSNYTNGAKYSIISPDLSPSAGVSSGIPEKILEYIHRLPFISNTPKETAHKIEFSFGQNMYTPTDTSRSDLIPDDRPYAGWSYLSTSYHRKSRLENNRSIMDTVEIQLGMVGSASHAEETQKRVHELRHLDIPQGWDHQLANEPGIVLAFERKWLTHPTLANRTLGYDAITHAGFAVGNVSTYANTGMEVRLGWNIPETFGVSLIRPAGSTRMDTHEKPGIYAMAALDSRLVIRDIFLDGNTFTDSHSVSKKPLTASVAYGLAFNYGPLMITLTEIRQSRTFDEQIKPHSYGALCASWFFSF
ncbi:MAG: lipid A deacylase LpxR family protein [Pseudomonadota bacterium]